MWIRHNDTIRFNRPFRTRMRTVIPVDVAEALMGHEEYLTEVYRKYSVDDLAKFYLQGESALLIFTEAEEAGKLRVEERNKQLQILVSGLATENLELKIRMAKMELKNMDLKRRIQHIEDRLGNIEPLIQDLKKQIPES